MATAISGMAQLGKTYTYDQLNRLTASQTYEDGNATTKYSTAYSYDANGNIISLSRTGNTGNMDNLTYNYTKDAAGNTLNNRLLHVNDAVTTTAYTVDIDDQGAYAQNNQNAQNYAYDKIGNLIKDKAEEIAEIKWTVQGKVAEIKRTATSIKPDLLFTYDALGNRISKTVVQKTTGDVNTTYYVRDAQGNVMATYEKNSSGIALEEHYLYGSSRLGLRKPSGEKNYELTNHLGNVLAVVSDTKNADSTANVVNATDYYPGGSPMPGRNFNANSYRYGYNKGSEKDDEISGAGNHFTTFYREGDTRLLTWWSVDPKADEQPWQSPYSYMDGNPIKNNDPDGDFVPQLIGALIGGGVELGSQLIENSFSDKPKDIAWGKVALAAGEGALTAGASALRTVAVKSAAYGAKAAYDYYNDDQHPERSVKDFSGKDAFNIAKNAATDAVVDKVAGGVAKGVAGKIGKETLTKTASKTIISKTDATKIVKATTGATTKTATKIAQKTGLQEGTKQVAKAIREVPKTITETTGKAAGASKVNEFKDKTNLK